jgi:hypothetical protein
VHNAREGKERKNIGRWRKGSEEEENGDGWEMGTADLLPPALLDFAHPPLSLSPSLPRVYVCEI